MERGDPTKIDIKDAVEMIVNMGFKKNGSKILLITIELKLQKGKKKRETVKEFLIYAPSSSVLVLMREADAGYAMLPEKSVWSKVVHHKEWKEKAFAVLDEWKEKGYHTLEKPMIEQREFHVHEGESSMKNTEKYLITYTEGVKANYVVRIKSIMDDQENQR
ncbi:MAG: hypothetical protein ACOC32_04980 [Nanoarchaeota archaeon]